MPQVQKIWTPSRSQLQSSIDTLLSRKQRSNPSTKLIFKKPLRGWKWTCPKCVSYCFLSSFSLTDVSSFPVYRLVYSSWLWLSWTYKRCRPQISPQTYSRTRELGLHTRASSWKVMSHLNSQWFSQLITFFRAASKEEAAEEGKKKKGGISVPEEWPWEEAKKIFEKPDVIPADDVQVGILSIIFWYTQTHHGYM